MSKPRGRPRKFDVNEALGNALLVFWGKGFAGTSLDDLAHAMAMKRPSIYNAFGDKQSLYRAALGAFQDRLNSGLELLLEEQDVKVGLNRFFTRALDVYMMGETPLGCFIFCTAPAEAVAHPDVRDDILGITTRTDKALKTFFENAQHEGHFPTETDPRVAAQVTQATLHSLALRSRAGQSRSTLNRMAKGAVEMICR
jgi:AcrR family transcriptional regulator